MPEAGPSPTSCLPEALGSACLSLHPRPPAVGRGGSSPGEEPVVCRPCVPLGLWSPVLETGGATLMAAFLGVE